MWKHKPDFFVIPIFHCRQPSLRLLYCDASMIVENICCQGSVLGYEFYFRSKVLCVVWVIDLIRLLYIIVYLLVDEESTQKYTNIIIECIQKCTNVLSYIDRFVKV